MLIIIDESGDPSFSVNASEHFTIGGIIFEDYRQAELAAKAFAKIKIETGFGREIKFNSCPLKLRDTIFKKLSPLIPYKFAGSINKKNIKDTELRKNSKEFYRYILMKSLKALIFSGHINPENNISFKLDNYGDRNFKISCCQAISELLPKAQTKFINSQNDLLVQLADLYVGSFAKKAKSVRMQKDRKVIEFILKEF